MFPFMFSIFKYLDDNGHGVTTGEKKRKKITIGGFQRKEQKTPDGMMGKMGKDRDL